MGPNEREGALAISQNTVVTDAARALAAHALVCTDSECDVCARQWRTKDWVRKARSDDENESIKNAAPQARGGPSRPPRL
jgi:hypothetical protein